MSDIHIDDFYKDTAKILVLLYGHFPRKITLYVDDISGPDTPDEFGLQSPRYQACFHTMLWLSTTGYLSYGQMVYQDALDEACLTHRAFLLLNSPLGYESEQDQEMPPLIAGLKSSAINRLKEELASGTSYSLAEFMNRLMAESRRFS